MAQIKLFLYSLVLLGAAVSSLQHDTLAADFCGVRANAACAKKGCAGAQLMAAPSCEFQCTRCDSKKALGLVTKTTFESVDCTGVPKNVTAASTGRCRGQDFTSCSATACYTRSYAQEGCRGAHASEVVPAGQCMPNGDGGSELLNSVPTLRMTKSTDSPCPYGDVHKILCAGAIANCVGQCLGGISDCLTCIGQYVTGGDLTMCCQTLSYYVGYDCSDCNFQVKNL